MRLLKLALCALVVLSLLVPLAVYYAEISGIDLTGVGLVGRLRADKSKFQTLFNLHTGLSTPQSAKVTLPVPITTVAITPSSPTTRTPKRYMISLVYAEQLTNAFLHYNEFLSLATSWNYTGVEPFVKNSRMSGFQTLFPDTYKIRLLLDMVSFHEQYQRCVGNNSTMLIEPMDSFLHNSFRDIVVVYFSKHMFVLDRNIHKTMDTSLKEEFSRHKEKAVVSCTKLASQSLTPAVRDQLHREQLNNSLTKDDEFTIREVLCINPAVELSLVEMMDEVSNHTGLNASVLFVSWQGKYTRKFPDLKPMGHCLLNFNQVQFSAQVKNSASAFITSKGLKPDQYISLHARFEKVFEFAYKKHASNESGYYTCCMKKLELILQELSNRTGIPVNHTLFVSDYSAYGSDSCHYQGHWNPGQVCREQTAKMMSLLSVKQSEFDPASHGGHKNTGFVSLVEETSLFDGRVLVTVGGGQFQNSIVGRFMAHHRNTAHSDIRLHYHICNEKEYVDGLTTELPKC